jgi:acetate---CoA ligase (ADP-forming)
MKLSRLVNPLSIGILGASERPSIGRTLMQSLERLGFCGAVYPINPKYSQIGKLKCYPSLRDLPEPADVVALCVGPERLAEHFRSLAESGAGAAVVYGGGFAERDEPGRKLQSELVDICREAGIAMCGPNCMGILNPVAGSTTYIYEVRDPTGLAGNVGLITQSGSIGNGMLGDIRRFGFSLVASTGNEAIVDTAAFIEHLIDDPNTRVIGTFTETVRSPERYIAALDRAAACGKPVVVLKVGRSARARHAITTHTGGLAGESRVFSEVLRAHRAIEVADLDEFTEVLAVCQGRRWPHGRRIAVTTGSGGQAELILDVATAAGLELPPLPFRDRAIAEQVLGPITGDGNPLDSWGTGDWRTNLPHALATLNASDANDAIVFCADCCENQPMIGRERLLDEMRLLVDAAQRSEKPHYLMNTRPGLMNSIQIAFLAENGIAQIGGTRQGLGAIDQLGRYASPLPPLRQLNGSGQGALAKILSAEPGRRTINEFDAKQLLAAYGLPTTRERVVASLAEAKTAAVEIGFPIVLKVVSDDVPHKSEHGLVVTRVWSDSDLAVAWEVLQRRIDLMGRAIAVKGFLVQEWIGSGIEVFAGVVRDPDFGPTIAFGMGGLGIEIIGDFALRMLPLREGDAEAMIAQTRAAALLGPYCNQAGADMQSLIECIYGLADFARCEAEGIAEIDLNPIKVRSKGQGCMIVDALIVAR